MPHGRMIAKLFVDKPCVRNPKLMHRENILNLLQSYAVKHAAERSCVAEYERFVEQHSDCFDRSQLAGHVTGSAWLVNTAATHVLLTHHRKLNLWLQLGGHADGEPDVLSVALREAREESGITLIEPVSRQLFDVDIHSIPARTGEPEHFHYDARFAFRTLTTDEFVVSDESHALEWIEIARLSERTTEASMLRMAEKWLHG